MRWLIYALGGGLGHLTRSLALARAAGRQNIECVILSNSPGAQWIPVHAELHPSGRLVAIPSDFDRAAVASRVKSTLQATQFDVLIVDTFPRGLGGELASLLPEIPVPRVLVHRDLNPKYVESHELDAFVTTYDCLLLPGENGPLNSHPRAIRTEPWLIRDADELLSRSQAREQLLGRDSSQQPIVLVSGSGRPEEVDEMERQAEMLRHVFSEHAHVCFSGYRYGSEAAWPLLSLMSGIDVLVGAGGYNTVAEARATETPLLAFPQPRLYDRQQHRLRPDELVQTGGELVQKLRTLITRTPATGSAQTRYRNGTHAAVEAIRALATESIRRDTPN